MCERIDVVLPGYDVAGEIDYEGLGARVDRILERLPDGDYVQRAIGVQDHPGLTVDDLAARVLAHGTDRTDPDRRSVFDDDFSDYAFDLHGSAFSVRHGHLVFEPDGFASCFAETIYDFHRRAPIDRGYAVRVDLVLVYRADALLPARQVAAEKPWSAPYARFCHRFADPDGDRGLCALLVLR